MKKPNEYNYNKREKLKIKRKIKRKTIIEKSNGYKLTKDNKPTTD